MLSLVCETFASFGLAVNLDAGKAEVLIAFYGTSSETVRRRVASEDNAVLDLPTKGSNKISCLLVFREQGFPC